MRTYITDAASLASPLQAATASKPRSLLLRGGGAGILEFLKLRNPADKGAE